MSYTIIRTNGTILTSIPDGVVNSSSTSLSLPGRNFASYGQLVNTNFIRILENFANISPPSNPIRGQLWFNTTTKILHICPTDGETNPANWYPILSPRTITDLTLNNLTANEHISANNISVSNDINTDDIITNNLVVNNSANISTANIGNVNSNLVTTTEITASTIGTKGNITGAWKVHGSANIEGRTGTSLHVTGGNLVVHDSSVQVGIKTDNYMFANGQPVSFDGTYTNANVQVFLPTYVGNFGAVGSNTTFNGRTLTTGANTTTGTITGTWTLTPGSVINGLSNIAGANVVGAVALATNANMANTANTAGTVTTSAQPNITSVGTLTSLSVSGNLSAGNISTSGVITGNGAGLTNVPITSLVGTFPTVPSANFADNANTAITVTGNNQPNITSVGTLTGLTVQGNVSLAGQIINLGQVANLRILGGVAGHVLTTNGNGVLSWQSASHANTAITVTANAQPNITSVGTLNNLTVSGNITAGNISAAIGTIVASQLGGTLITSSQPNITNIGTLTSLSVSGNVTFTGPVVNLGTVANLRITGGNPGQILTSSGGGIVTWANPNPVAQTVAANAQPNITSVGTLTGLTVQGNVSLTGHTINLGQVANLRILGGAPGQVLATDGNGGLSWQSTTAAVTSITVTGNNQPNITSVGTLTSLSVSGNLSAGNITTNGTIAGSGAELNNINASNITTGTLSASRLSGTYNINITGSAASANFATNAGSANTAINATNAANANDSLRAQNVTANAQPNITSVGTLTSLSVSGNLSAGNISTSGVITGNGAGLNNINASNITTGTLSASRLSGTYNINITGSAASANFATTAGSANTASYASSAGTATTATNASTAQTVTNNSQPNITSVGTLTSLSVSGSTSLNNVSVTNLSVGGSLTRNGVNVLTTNDFQGSLDHTGWTRLPNGLMFQWGTVYLPGNVGGVTHSFPVPFSISAFQVFLTLRNNPNDNDEADEPIWVSSFTNTSFTIFASGDRNPVIMSYFAIGV
jgi:hypothetical protein